MPCNPEWGEYPVMNITHFIHFMVHSSGISDVELPIQGFFEDFDWSTYVEIL